MRWNRKEWHRWWAWHPVQLENGEWVWLEYVERRWEEVHKGWSVAPGDSTIFHTSGYVYRWISK